MRKTVYPDFARIPGMVAEYGKEYDATSNQYGAICAICANGEKIGVKPDEFDFAEAPEWLWEIHTEKDRDRWKARCEALEAANAQEAR